MRGESGVRLQCSHYERITMTKSKSAPIDTEAGAAAAPTREAQALSVQERKALKAQAHHLNPVVMIGDAGLTPAVLREVDLALRSHQLIKVRVQGDDREARTQLYEALCEQCGASPVQHIGKLLVVYRPLSEEDIAAAQVREEKQARANAARRTAARQTAGKADAEKPSRAGAFPARVVKAPRPSTGKVRGKLGERLAQRALVGSEPPKIQRRTGRSK
jgi:RNA-binding protein